MTGVEVGLVLQLDGLALEGVGDFRQDPFGDGPDEALLRGRRHRRRRPCREVLPRGRRASTSSETPRGRPKHETCTLKPAKRSVGGVLAVFAPPANSMKDFGFLRTIQTLL